MEPSDLQSLGFLVREQLIPVGRLGAHFWVWRSRHPVELQIVWDAFEVARERGLPLLPAIFELGEDGLADRLEARAQQRATKLRGAARGVLLDLDCLGCDVSQEGFEPLYRRG
ncbi:MAG: hypothetical protein FWD17_02870 [Polyangiaceae bacterium]|nr:hypothetical protein [Polyangiaceae bacterium]